MMYKILFFCRLQTRLQFGIIYEKRHIVVLLSNIGHSTGPRQHKFVRKIFSHPHLHWTFFPTLFLEGSFQNRREKEKKFPIWYKKKRRVAEPLPNRKISMLYFLACLVSLLLINISALILTYYIFHKLGLRIAGELFKL